MRVINIGEYSGYNGSAGSMSKKACCWVNAVAESFFGSLKQERVHW
jgi:putative transposase